MNKSDITKRVDKLRKIAQKKFKLHSAEAQYLVFPISIKNQTYNFIDNEIKFLKKNNVLVNLSDIKHELNMNTRNSRIIKHYICYPKECEK